MPESFMDIRKELRQIITRRTAAFRGTERQVEADVYQDVLDYLDEMDRHIGLGLQIARRTETLIYAMQTDPDFAKIIAPQLRELFPLPFHELNDMPSTVIGNFQDAILKRAIAEQAAKDNAILKGGDPE